MKHRILTIKHLALALALGAGLGASRVKAQTILEVGGSGTIGDTVLATNNKVPTAGTWAAAGGEGFKNSDLISPPVAVTTTGPVTLKFSHRYFFEKEWDGGAVFVIVNGTPATYLPITAFSANPYVGDTLVNGAGAAWPGGEKVFFDKSAGYDTRALIESVANLGTLTAGDTVSVQFRGRWDGGYAEPAPNWEMGKVNISDSVGTLLDVDFSVVGTSGFTVASDAGLAGPWLYLKGVSRFEINADSLTADRYKPAAPGAVIDLNGANISVVLLGGTLAANETFTLFDLSGGSTLTGTPGTITLPPGYWNTSNLAVNGTITCVLPAMPPPSVPVTSGMKVWLAADAVDPTDPTQVDGTGKVQQWNDLSGNSFHATNTTAGQRPAYITNGMNGKPVLRFTQADSSKLFLGDLSASFAPIPPPPVDLTPTAVNRGTLGAAVDGTYANIPTRGVTGALVGDNDTATSLNGTTQYVNIPYSADLNPPQGQPWSAEIWAKSNVSGVLPPFSSGTPGNVTNRQGWVLYFFNSDLSFRAYTNNAANATINGGNGLTIPGLITPNTWYHVVVTCDGTDFRIYLNGVEVGSTPTVGPNGTYSAGNTGTALGIRLGAGNYFNGTLDEAAFYTTTLTQPRIQAHYKNGINDPQRSQSYDLEIAVDSPVAHYKLNEPATTSPVVGASVFAVAAPNNDARYNLFGNRTNDDRWVADTWSESRPGSFREGRSQSASFTLSDWPTTGSHVFALESSNAAFNVLINGSSIGTDTGAYNNGAGTSWTIGDSAANNDQRLNGDIAELILFDRILTAQEAALVGGYLTQKYQLTTTYPPANLAVALNTPENALPYPSGVPVQATVTVAEVGTAPFAVEYWVDGALKGTATTAPYSLDLGILANGTHSIYAKVIDSSTPTAISAFSAAHIFSVAPATGTTTTLASSANPSTYGEGMLTATVVANNASPLTGGTVQFLDAGEPLGNPVAVDIATGLASYNINKLGAGTRSLTATYSGHGVHTASSAPAISQVVEKATLTFTANNVFRPNNTANPDPLPYKITGFQNGETLATSGVTGDPLLTTPAVLSSPPGNYTITCAQGDLAADNYSFMLVNSTLTVADVPDTFSVNFFVGPEWPFGGMGEFASEEVRNNVKLASEMPAGLGDWFTSGWANYLVPWAPTAARPPIAVTSNRGSTATFTLIDCRNGWTHGGAARTTLLGDGNGNMMDAHVNSTLDPDNGATNSFKMEMTDIPFATYDVIFYMGANAAQYGDGKGAIVFNGAAERDFTIKSGAFDGTFIEMVDATTPGNYIVFKGVTGSTFTTQTYGKGPTGFNHIGPFGFQIRPAATDYGTWAKGFPGVDLSDPNADLDGDGWTNDQERLFGLNPTSGASVNPFTVPFDSTAGTFSFTRRDNALTGKFTDVETSTDLQTWTVDRGAVLVDNGPNANGVEIVNVTISPGLLAAPRLFVRINQRDASVPLSENFETGNGGFTVLTDSGSNWAWGDPDSTGPGGTVTQGNGGSINCWGTNIGNPGFYITPTVTRLRSVEVDLTNVSAAQLTFAEALDLEAGDSAVVNIIESATNTVISPAIYTATDPNSALAAWEVANAGNPIPIPAAAIGKKVRIEWRLSGQAVDYFGWYIDDVMVKQVAP